MDKLVRQQALSPAEKDEKTRPMEKEKRNYVEELENLKTAFIGYDKEAVLTYIQILLDTLEEEQQQKKGRHGRKRKVSVYELDVSSKK